jgi:ABC-type branched-subunit amino acid transport system ATPase component
VSALVVENLRKTFGGVRAVDGVSFALGDGDVAALIGPNGAGKSTLFNLIDGQLAPDDGRVHYRGHALDRLPTAARTRLGTNKAI